MPLSRSLSTSQSPSPLRRHLVHGGLLAGLALTGTALSMGAPHQLLSGPEQPVTVSQAAAVAPSPVPVAPVRFQRASRGAMRTAIVGYVTREVATRRSFSGQASWYGGSFQGQRTANGERFNTHDLTAASRTLPFGTRLRVCHSGRCVVVRINDRGPYVGNRVLDLSMAARDRLGSFGVAYVTATPVHRRRVPVVRHVPVLAPPAPVTTVVPVLTDVQPRLAAQSTPAPQSSAADGMLAGGALLAGASGLGVLRRRRLAS